MNDKHYIRAGTIEKSHEGDFKFTPPAVITVELRKDICGS